MNAYLLSGEALSQSLVRSFVDSKKLVVISAYVTKPAIDWLASVIDGHNVDVVLVARISLSDIMMGSTDFSALQKALKLGWKVKRLKNLHAKITLVDERDLFVGSANFTNNGLVLVGGGNVEATIQMIPDQNSLNFVRRVVELASPITLQCIGEMQSYIDDVGLSKNSDWPRDFFDSTEGILVNDFPLVEPGEKCALYETCPDLLFAKIEGVDSTHINKTTFLNSKSFFWLTAVLYECEGQCAQFGYITARLHESLIDDPAPYRRDVKQLLSNLLKYVDKYAGGIICISRPNYSQRVCLVNDNG